MEDWARVREPIKLDEPLETEDAFFAALLEGDVESLRRLLADDFVIVELRRGEEVGRSDFLAAIAAWQVSFTALRVVDRRVRRYGEVAVVVGRTAMRGRVGEEQFSASSHYTHVFVRTERGDWRLASAQGTPIVEQDHEPA